MSGKEHYITDDVHLSLEKGSPVREVFHEKQIQRQVSMNKLEKALTIFELCNLQIEIALVVKIRPLICGLCQRKQLYLLGQLVYCVCILPLG